MVDIGRLHGDPKYFGSLMEAHGALIWNLAQKHATDFDEAEDLYQVIWTHAWTKRHTYNDLGSFRGWLYRLATNISYSYQRSRARETDVFLRYETQHRAGERTWHPSHAVTELVRNRRLRILRDAVNELPERQRAAIEFRYVHDLSAEEIGAEMDVTQATARSLLRHALKRLRTLLEISDDDLPRRDTAD